MMSITFEWHTIGVPENRSYTNSEIYVSRNATYGLQAALSSGRNDKTTDDYPNDSNNETIHFALFNDACPSSGCTDACEGNFATMFLNMGLQTLHNCFLLPLLAIKDPKVNTKIAAVSSVYPLDTNFTNAAIHVTNTILGKSLISPSSMNHISRARVGCLKDVCNDTRGCRENEDLSAYASLDATSLENFTTTRTILDGVGDVLYSICGYDWANQVNPDLGGIGVSPLQACANKPLKTAGLCLLLDPKWLSIARLRCHRLLDTPRAVYLVLSACLLGGT